MFSKQAVNRFISSPSCSRTSTATNLIRKTRPNSNSTIKSSSSSIIKSSTFTTSSIQSSSTPLASTSNEPIFFNKVSIVKPNSSTTTTGEIEHFDQIPAFRLLSGEGKLLPGVEGEWLEKLEAIPDEVLIKIYKTMLLLPTLDTILASSQRQGRISFYMTSYGEEGSVIGSAAAWDSKDEVFAQYREVGVLLWRGYKLSSLMAQVFSTASDTATLGKQMPVHHGSAEHHFQTISSPLGTQIPQAAGAGYALKRMLGREENCAVCYMGEGAASEGDFHAGLNMASVLSCPVVFVVRNNGFAISTPSSEQYRGDGVASRGPGYGIDTVRVDGNDPLAVYLACKEGRRRAVEGHKPVLIECMSYRVGHHSTSDDSSAYRSLAAVESIKKLDSPLFRLRSYLESRPTPLWSDELETSTKAEHRKEIMKEFSKSEKEKKPALDNMWGDVYGGDELERPIREQRAELQRLVGKWGESTAWKKELEKFAGGKEAFLKAT